MNAVIPGELNTRTLSVLSRINTTTLRRGSQCRALTSCEPTHGVTISLLPAKNGSKTHSVGTFL